MAQRSRRRPPRRSTRTTQTTRQRSLSWPVILAGIAIVAIGLFAVIGLSLLAGGDNDEADTELAQAIEQSRRGLPPDMIDGLALGSPDAPLVVELFEDFQCPFCIGFTANIEPAIINEYVRTGDVRLEFNNYPILGAESEAAARASVCAAEQGDGWSYALSLFRTQAEEGQVSNERLNVGRFDRDGLVDVAEENGLDMAAFESCLDHPDSLQQVQEQFLRGQSLGVRGTPAFALNGEPIAPGGIDGWRDTLDRALAEATAP